MLFRMRSLLSDTCIFLKGSVNARLLHSPVPTVRWVKAWNHQSDVIAEVKRKKKTHYHEILPTATWPDAISAFLLVPSWWSITLSGLMLWLILTRREVSSSAFTAGCNLLRNLCMMSFTTRGIQTYLQVRSSRRVPRVKSETVARGTTSPLLCVWLTAAFSSAAKRNSYFFICGYAANGTVNSFSTLSTHA